MYDPDIYDAKLWENLEWIVETAHNFLSYKSDGSGAHIKISAEDFRTNLIKVLQHPKDQICMADFEYQCETTKFSK